MVKDTSKKASSRGLRCRKSPSKVCQFFSKSAEADGNTPLSIVRIVGPHWKRYLSNFAEPKGGIEVEGLHFRSIEHAFAAAKVEKLSKPIHSSRARYASTKDIQRLFSLNGGLGKLPASTIKSYHSKTGMRKHLGRALDVDDYNQKRRALMTTLINLRAEKDNRFRQLLLILHRHGLYMLHFHRSGGNGWAAYIGKKDKKMHGENMLGEIMMETAKDIYSKDSNTISD